MTYEEIKDAARWVEQREDPSMSDDPVCEGKMQPQPHRMMDNGIRADHPIVIRVSHSTGGQTRPSSQSWPAVRAVNLEDPRGDSPDRVDSPITLHHCFPAPTAH